MDCCDSKFVVVSVNGRNGKAGNFGSKEVVARFPSDAAKKACNWDGDVKQEPFGDAEAWHVWDAENAVDVIVVFVEDCDHV